MPIPTDAPPLVNQLAAALFVPSPMRRGSLSERTIKCGKPGCGCADDPEARHGPYFSLTRAVKGKTQSRFLSPEQAAIVRQQIDTGHKFRDNLDAFWESCEQWADSQLAPLAHSSEEAQKGGSKKTFKTESSRRSKRS